MPSNERRLPPRILLTQLIADQLAEDDWIERSAVVGKRVEVVTTDGAEMVVTVTYAAAPDARVGTETEEQK